MGYNQAYSAYQKTNVTTASQGRLIVLMYEASVRNLKEALKLVGEDGKLKPADIEKFGKYIQKVQAIVAELQVTLDMEKGGEIAKNLMSLYVYFNSELMDISITHSAEKITSIMNMLNELLSAWRFASNSTANAPAAAEIIQATLNIEG